MNPKNVIEAVCSGFNKQPRACRRFLRTEGITLNNRYRDGITKRTLAAIVVGLVVTGCVIMLIYRRCMKTEMQEEMKVQVSSAVSQYIALSQITELEDPEARQRAIDQALGRPAQPQQA